LNFKSRVTFYFCCVYPAVLILTLIAHYIPMKLLLIYTGNSESRVNPFVLNIDIYAASRGGIHRSLCLCKGLALLLHCHGFLQHQLEVSPAGIER